jgi:hypothetical protein
VTALLFVAVLCMVILITSFIFPALVAYIYIPLSLLIMILAGVICIIRYFGIYMPYIDQNLQNNFIKSHSTASLILGVAFIISFIVSGITVFVKR